MEHLALERATSLEQIIARNRGQGTIPLALSFPVAYGNEQPRKRLTDLLARAGILAHLVSLAPDEPNAFILREFRGPSKAPDVFCIVAFPVQRVAGVTARPVAVYLLSELRQDDLDGLRNYGTLSAETYTDLCRLKENPSATVQGLDSIKQHQMSDAAPLDFTPKR